MLIMEDYSTRLSTTAQAISSLKAVQEAVSLLKHAGLAQIDACSHLGTWLLDFSSQLPPSSILHGVDISTSLFPQFHPPNISFCQGSITKLPSQWTNRFDFVHQRLLTSGLSRTDWTSALEEIYRVLVPGGWVQLGEIGVWGAGSITGKHWNMTSALVDSRNGDLRIAENLPDLLASTGFVNVSVEARTISMHGPSVGAQNARRNASSTFYAMKTAILQGGGFGFVSSEKEFDDLMLALEKEWNEVESAGFDFKIIYGQKPEKVL